MVLFWSSVLFIRTSSAPCSESDYLASRRTDVDIQWHYGIHLSSLCRRASSLKYWWYALRGTWNVWTLLVLFVLYSVRRLIRFEMCLFLFIYFFSSCRLLRTLTMILIDCENRQVRFKDTKIYLDTIGSDVTSLTSCSLGRTSEEHPACSLLFIPLVKHLRTSLQHVYYYYLLGLMYIS